MIKHGPYAILIVAALIAAPGGVVTSARAQIDTPNLQDAPPQASRPSMSLDEQRKLKKELNSTRYRLESRPKANEKARMKAKKP